jgi:hypothetical protein
MTNPETEATTPETTETASPKNGAGKEVPQRDPSEPIVLERIDVLELLLVGEKQKRLQAEADRVNIELGQATAESNTLTEKLNQKYGVDLNGAAVAPDGTVTLPDSSITVKG